MRRRLLLALIVTAGLSAPAWVQAAQGQAPGQALEKAPWFGTWQLNPARSTSRAAPSPYRRVTFSIEPAEDGVKATYRMVGTRGGVTRMEWSGPFNGKDYAVQGVDNVLTNAYRRLDDRSYEIVVKVEGQVAATATARVSPDGKVLSVATSERAPDGQRVNTVAVYDKQ